MPREPIPPPDWWNRNLYCFVQAMSPEGWVWEFMRRARLLQVLSKRNSKPNVHVDAMNPDPDTESLSGHYLNYYNSWYWYFERNSRPVFLPPAALPPEGWPRGFQGQQYRIHPIPDADPDIKQKRPKQHFISIGVDLNRRDSVIKRDFNEILRSERAQHPEPRRRNPRFSNWPNMQILEVWDLRQFNLFWPDIVLALGRCRSRDDVLTHHISSVRNAHRTAQFFINEGNWLDLACRIDVE
jgi:hypothetical protein